MKTLQRYIGRDVLLATLLIFVALLALFAFFDLIHELGDWILDRSLTVLKDWPGQYVSVNFSPRQIGPFMSEVLTLGFPDEKGEVVLIGPSLKVPNGGRLF